MNKEEIPVRILNVIQNVSVGMIVALMLIMILNPTSVLITVNVGMITMFVILMLLSLSLINCDGGKGIILNTLAMLAIIYTQLTVEVSDVVLAYGAGGLNIISLSWVLVHSMMITCCVVWVFTTINTLKAKD